MKVLEIGYNTYYRFPDGIGSLEDFITYLNQNYHSFIPMVELETEKCVSPYFIEEDTKNVYLNVSSIEKVSQIEATILSRAEYERQLHNVVQAYCVNCRHYEEDLTGDNLTGHREKLCLDGSCWGFSKKES